MINNTAAPFWVLPANVFGNMSLSIVLCAGNCNYSGSGSVRFALMDITPWVNQEKYIYQFTDPAPGVNQGVRIPSEYTMYTEFYPHQYFWKTAPETTSSTLSPTKVRFKRTRHAPRRGHPTCA
jgi:hypothetical protein